MSAAPLMLDLFSGTGSASEPMRAAGWTVAPRHALALVPAALPKLAARIAELVEARAAETESALAAITAPAAAQS